MKSAVIASLLFGSLALAAPMNKRDLVTKTQTVVETVVVYTTVYDDAVPTGAFYEKPAGQPGAPGAPGAPGQPGQPGAPGSAATTTAAAAPVETPAAQPETTPAPEPAPATTEQAQPTTTAEQQQAPQQQVQQAAPTTTQEAAPAQTSQAPSSQPASSSGSTGETYSNVDITIYDNNGGFGACGTELHDSDMIVALAKDAWGASTYDVMTGAATNPWCGKKINIDYNGNTIQATIMDLCPGCSGHDIDLSLSAWKALTGMDEKTRLKASWSLAA